MHAETLERSSIRSGGRGGRGGGGGGEGKDEGMEDMVKQLNTHWNATDGDAQQIDWFVRLRARMRIDRTLQTPHNGDPSNIVLRKRLFASIPMGVGVVPLYHPNLVSHRQRRVSLIKFTPAKEFTQEEVIRQRRARKSNIGGIDKQTTLTGAGEQPPELPNLAPQHDLEHDVEHSVEQEHPTPAGTGKVQTKETELEATIQKAAAQRLKVSLFTCISQ